jgi:8-oxo-dGTP pyrophosphatase MutT (NUDIX family)
LSGPTPARDAATVVLLRDGPVGLETCLLRRTASARFVPGVHVFPGGAVDPADAHAAALVDGLDDSSASLLTGVGSGGLSFWVAAVRESLEEAGVAPAIVSGGANAPASVDLSKWRTAVHDGSATLAHVLSEERARIDGRGVRCFARWVTPLEAPRRFDTRFFVAAVPRDAEIVPDGSEIVAHEWMAPGEALERSAAGRMAMILPTVRTLKSLESFGDVASAMSGLSFGDPADALLPEVLLDGDRRLVRVPGDPEGTGGVYDGDTGMPVA